MHAVCTVCCMIVGFLVGVLLQDTVAALMGSAGVAVEGGKTMDVEMTDECLDGVPLEEDQITQFEHAAELDGEPLVCVV